MRRRHAIPLIAATALALLVVALAVRAPAPRPAASPSPGLDFTRPPAADPVPWDNVTWKHVLATGLEIPPGGHVDGMVAWSHGLIAYGQADLPAGVQGIDGIPSVGTLWFSSDAIAWRAVPMLAGVPPGTSSEIHTVAAGPKGIVAIGNICCVNERRAAWWSGDGVTWKRGTFPRALDGGALAAAAGAMGFVATGMVGNDAALWSSKDGVEWQLVNPDDRPLGRGQLRDVATTPTGFVAVGEVDVAKSDSDGVVFVSDDLVSWRRSAAADPTLTGGDEVSLGLVVPYAGGLFAGGGIGTKQERVSCEQLLSGAASAGASLALSCGWLRDMTWRAGGVDAWERVDPWGADATFPPDFVPPGRAPANWSPVVAGGPGLVALPYELEQQAIQNSGDELGVWVSANARDWRRVAAGPVLAAGFPGAFVVVGRQLLVVSDKGDVYVGTVLP